MSIVTQARRVRLSKDAGKLAAAVRVLPSALGALDYDHHLSLELIWDEMETRVSREELRAAVAHLTGSPSHRTSILTGTGRVALVDRGGRVIIEAEVTNNTSTDRRPVDAD